MQLINGLSKNLFIINQQNLTKESAEAQSKLIGLLETWHIYMRNREEAPEVSAWGPEVLR